MRTRLLFLAPLALAFLFLGGCEPQDEDAERMAQHCGSCHLAPAPDALPRNIWENRVLPEMGARLGMRTLGYDPVGQLGPEEYALAQAHGFYPDRPALTYEAWASLRQYILERAPDTLPAPPRLEPQPLDDFVAHRLDVDGQPGSLVTFLGFRDRGLLVGTGYGQLAHLSPAGERTALHSVRRPVVHYQADTTGGLLLEIGNIYPTEASNGVLYRFGPGGRQILADTLHRPVHFLAEDLDGDGVQEIIVSEFGNYSGALTLLKRGAGGEYQRKRLLGTAGATRVVGADLNRDGRRDLIVLHAQGDEGIDALYQRADGTFERDRLLRFSPVWGTSWFELVDFDGDGDLDLITVHGDNADYSNVRKPYHGLRIYTNDGANAFTEIYFQPLPGATRVVARDFDRDGDTDLAVASNFADFAREPEAAFAYLENVSSAPGSVRFQPRTTPVALDGRWLILEAADYDGDGDDDLALGSFTLSPAPVPDTLATRWRDSNTDVILLENRRY